MTGHCKGETDAVDWAPLARPGHTTVFYMGLGHLQNIVARLQEHGAPADRPAAVIEQGTRAAQRVVTGTLADLESKVRTAGIESPALLIVGDVTQLHSTLHWFNSTQADADLDPRRLGFALAGTHEGRLSA